MRITRSERAGEELVSSLKGKMASNVDSNAEDRLEEKRDELKDKPQASTTEVLLNDVRKDEKVVVVENMLREKEPKGNAALKGTTEERLNKASKEDYPHRNEDAWKRTGDKRPVNALNEEMGEGGDEGKLKRWEQAQKAAPGLDQDIVAGYNQKRASEESKLRKFQGDVGTYLAYRKATNPWSPNLKEAKKIDQEIVSVLKTAFESNRSMTKEEMEKVANLKKAKTKILGVQWRNGI